MSPKKTPLVRKIRSRQFQSILYGYQKEPLQKYQILLEAYDLEETVQKMLELELRFVIRRRMRLKESIVRRVIHVYDPAIQLIG